MTIYLSSPINALINEDLPAFGLPTTANLGRVSSNNPSSLGNFLINESNNSPVPLPLTLDIE